MLECAQVKIDSGCYDTVLHAIIESVDSSIATAHHEVREEHEGIEDGFCPLATSCSSRSSWWKEFAAKTARLIDPDPHYAWGKKMR